MEACAHIFAVDRDNVSWNRSTRKYLHKCVHKYRSSDRIDRRKEDQHSPLCTCCLFFFVGKYIGVSDEQGNGSHEQGLLHIGGRAWNSAQDTIKLLTCFGICAAEGGIWRSFKTRWASLVIVFMKTITSHPYGHKSLWLPIKGVLFQLKTGIIYDIWGVVIFEPVHGDFV